MPDGPAAPPPETLPELTCDAWLGGRLTLVQPKRSHRVGSDARRVTLAELADDGVEHLVDERHRGKLGWTDLRALRAALAAIHPIGEGADRRAVVEDDVAPTRRKEGVILP